MRKCICCGETKPLTEYYRAARGPEGRYVTKCKGCLSAYYKTRYPDIKGRIREAAKRRYELKRDELLLYHRVKSAQYRANNPDKAIQYRRDYYDANPEQCKEQSRQYRNTERGKSSIAASRQRNRSQAAARYAVAEAIKKGILSREPCCQCGKEKAHAHHEDYTQPLAVEWLCSKCHGLKHRALNDLAR